MADIDALKDEITTDPLVRGYAGMTDVEVADNINTLDRTRIKASMSGNELFRNTDSTQFSGLTDHKREIWVSFCSTGDIDPGDAANVAFVQYVFGGGATVSALNAARQETISRAQELGLGEVGPGHVWEARK